MRVLFVNTFGEVLTPEVEKIQPTSLGDMYLTENGIYICDREPDDEITRLDTNVMIDTLSRIRPLYDLTKPMQIYLPKMSDNLFVEGKIQTLMYQLIENIVVTGV